MAGFLSSRIFCRFAAAAALAAPVACAAAGVGSIDSRGGKAFIRRTNSDILEMEYEFKSDNPDRRIAELMVALREIRRAKAHPR